MRKEMEQLRLENNKLKVSGGGALSADDDARLLETFQGLLKRVLEMRSAGKFDATLFDEYNEAMVALSDGHVRELYQSFMLLYVEEATDADLAKLGLTFEQVDDATLGFAEMMSIKLGELMDQDRTVRMQALQAEKRKKQEREKARLEKEKRDLEKEAQKRIAEEKALTQRRK